MTAKKGNGTKRLNGREAFDLQEVLDLDRQFSALSPAEQERRLKVMPSEALAVIGPE